MWKELQKSIKSLEIDLEYGISYKHIDIRNNMISMLEACFVIFSFDLNSSLQLALSHDLS